MYMQFAVSTADKCFTLIPNDDLSNILDQLSALNKDGFFQKLILASSGGSLLHMKLVARWLEENKSITLLEISPFLETSIMSVPTFRRMAINVEYYSYFFKKLLKYDVGINRLAFVQVDVHIAARSLVDFYHTKITSFRANRCSLRGTAEEMQFLLDGFTKLRFLSFVCNSSVDGLGAPLNINPLLLHNKETLEAFEIGSDSKSNIKFLCDYNGIKEHAKLKTFLCRRDVIGTFTRSPKLVEGFGNKLTRLQLDMRSVHPMDYVSSLCEVITSTLTLTQLEITDYKVKEIYDMSPVIQALEQHPALTIFKWDSDPEHTIKTDAVCSLIKNNQVLDSLELSSLLIEGENTHSSVISSFKFNNAMKVFAWNVKVNERMAVTQEAIDAFAYNTAMTGMWYLGQGRIPLVVKDIMKRNVLLAPSLYTRVLKLATSQNFLQDSKKRNR